MNTHNTSVLVTGGGGYIGSVLVKRLLDAGYDVSVVDSFVSGRRSDVDSRATVFPIDIRDPGIHTVIRSVQPACVYHLAAAKSVSASQSNTDEYRSINVTGSKNVIDACISAGISRFVFTSTAGIYGDTRDGSLQSESDPPKPSSVYAETKLETEGYLRSLASPVFRPVILRFANVYGPGGSTGNTGVIQVFVDAIKRGKTIKIHGDGCQTRDFIYIGDLVAIAVSLCSMPMESLNGNSIVNVSSGQPTSVRQIVDMLKKCTGKTPTVEYLPDAFIGQQSSLLDPMLAQKLFGWKARMAFEDGIRACVGTEFI